MLSLYDLEGFGFRLAAGLVKQVLDVVHPDLCATTVDAKNPAWP